jgi:uncharacterized protein YqhQ
MPQAEYLQYGGQAIIEGVMMRSPRYFSVACRAPNGKIVLRTEALEKTWIGRQKWLKLPFLRGSLALLDAMALGIKAMRFASNVQMDEEHQPQPDPEAGEQIKTSKPPSKSVQSITIGLAMVVGLALGIFLFNVLPNLVSEHWFKTQTDMVKSLITETVKVVFFFGYIYGISRLPEIREVFKYHGAEHKAINTLEARQDLEMENCKLQTRLHPRCGTSFAVIVLIVGFILFPLVPRFHFDAIHPEWMAKTLAALARVGVELLILPIIAGISYEMIRFAGKFRNQRWVMMAFKPGILTQYITTAEPNDGQVEVALTALKAVVKAEMTGELAEDPAEVADVVAVEVEDLPEPQSAATNQPAQINK